MDANNNTYDQFRLLKQKRFLPYFVTQFLGAFNDNIFKFALLIMIAFQGTTPGDVDTDTLTNFSQALFILPFFLFSATAGQWVDRNEKSNLIRSVKLLEVLIMLCAAYALYEGHLYALIGLLFMMGTQSSLFGPAKYSYLPQHLKDNELVAGNALVQGSTFVAILVGTMLGGVLIAEEDGQQLVAIVLVCVAAAGYGASLFIPVTPSLKPDLKINWNPISETWRNIAFIHKDRIVFFSVLGISWFWFLGATYLVQLPSYTKLTLGGNEQVATLFLTMFAIGIGVGSLLCSWLSGHKVEPGLVPFGSIGLTLFGIDLYFAQPELLQTELIGAWAFLQTGGNLRILFDILMIGLFGGFYIVPLLALVQQRSEKTHLSRVIAGNNIFNALFMVLSAAMAIVLLRSGMTIAQLFLLIALLNAAVGVCIFYLAPEFFTRFLLWVRFKA